MKTLCSVFLLGFFCWLASHPSCLPPPSVCPSLPSICRSHKCDIFVNYNWVDTRWQYYRTHLHTNGTYNNTNNNRTTQITTNLEECRPCPVFANDRNNVIRQLNGEVLLHFCLCFKSSNGNFGGSGFSKNFTVGA